MSSPPASPRAAGTAKRAAEPLPPEAEPVRKRGRTVLTCPEEGCGKTFNHRAKLTRHLRTHTGERPFSCVVCGQKFRRKEHLHVHSAFKHSESAPASPSGPDSAGSLGSEAALGVAADEPPTPEEPRPEPKSPKREFICTLPALLPVGLSRLSPHPSGPCGKSFVTAGHLRAHERNVHGHTASGTEARAGGPGLSGSPGKYVCAECGTSFTKRLRLRAHMWDVHAVSAGSGDGGGFCCPYTGCEKVFPSLAKRRAHMKTHDPERYTCALPHPDGQSCTFPNWSALQAHMKTAHPPTCPFPECHGRTFVSRGARNAHVRSHAASSASAGAYACMYASSGCTKRYTTKQALDVHVRIAHLKIRPFVCGPDPLMGLLTAAHSSGADNRPDPPRPGRQGCGQSFGHKSLLLRHQRSCPVFRAQSAPRRTRRSSVRNFACPWAKIVQLRGESAQPPPPIRPTDAEADGRGAPAVVPDCSTPNRSSEDEDDDDDEDDGEDAEFFPSGGDESEDDGLLAGGDVCTARFGRLYDVQRHIRSVHGVDLSQEEVQALFHGDDIR